MSLAIVYSRACAGIAAPLVTVEAHLSRGMPKFNIVGLPEAAVKELGGAILAQVPLARFGEASEIAKAVAYLASSDAAFVTGTELLVDGGLAQA